MDIDERLQMAGMTEPGGLIRHEAAAEIERLREAVQAYLDAYDNATGTVYVEPLMREVMGK